ncbi:MAG: hypothetical protein GF315_14495 [candidate division Zixibacteria bacterium]|nr:hypothetical protein [candidate division Zixibacteria bacterium]
MRKLRLSAPDTTNSNRRKPTGETLPPKYSGRPAGEKRFFNRMNQVDRSLIEECNELLRSNSIGAGLKIRKLESHLTESFQVPYARAVITGAAALHLILLSQDIGFGDEVIISALSPPYLANCIVQSGAKPILLDVKSNGFNMDPERIEPAITPNTRAIVVVHSGGVPSDPETIYRIGAKHDLRIIEDASLAVGSEYKGKKIGSFGNFTYFSLSKMQKGGLCPGGVIIGAESDAFDNIDRMLNDGIDFRTLQSAGADCEIACCGYEYASNDLAAAIFLHQFMKLEELIGARKKHAKHYEQELREIEGLVLPEEKPGNRNSWFNYPVIVDHTIYPLSKTDLRDYLVAENLEIESEVIKPLHLHKYYRNRFGYSAGDFPNAENNWNNSIFLPTNPGLKDKDISDIVTALKRILKYYRIQNRRRHDIGTYTDGDRIKEFAEPLHAPNFGTSDNRADY